MCKSCSGDSFLSINSVDKSPIFSRQSLRNCSTSDPNFLSYLYYMENARGENDIPSFFISHLGQKRFQGPSDTNFLSHRKHPLFLTVFIIIFLMFSGNSLRFSEATSFNVLLQYERRLLRLRCFLHASEQIILLCASGVNLHLQTTHLRGLDFFF